MENKHFQSRSLFLLNRNARRALARVSFLSNSLVHLLIQDSVTVMAKALIVFFMINPNLTFA